MDRVHRLGQTRPVKQIRYVVEGRDSVERVGFYFSPLFFLFRELLCWTKSNSCQYMLRTQESKLALVEASVGDGSGPDREAVKDFLKVGNHTISWSRVTVLTPRLA